MYKRQVPFWLCVPFAGLLLCIALFPLLKPVWWENHQPYAVIFWSLLFIIPYALSFSAGTALETVLECMINDYLTFIILLFGLFCVSGNITMTGDLAGSPRINVGLLVLGTLLSSWIGTTGASMLMVRPVIKMNSWRRRKRHIIVFFIFLVSNIGGVLTPIGDPPLLMGFMRGVPFFWSLRMLPVLLFNMVLLLFVFYWIDRRAVSYTHLRMKKKATELFRRLGMTVNLSQPMRNMSVSQRQMCEIAKAISYNAKVIVLSLIHIWITVVDATCPFVKKIHRIVEEQNAAGRRVIIVGNEEHPEVQGIKGWGDTNTLVIESAEKLDDFHIPEEERLCMVAQTTFNYNKFQVIVEKILKKGYDILVLNTICNATQERQVEAKQIAASVDAMIVIGGQSSSNTRKLYEICSSECENTYFIQTLDDLDLQSVSSVRSVGITAGASTPNYIIEEVHTNVRVKF